MIPERHYERVIRLVREHSSLTRAQAGWLTGLSRASCSLILTDLVDDGILWRGPHYSRFPPRYRETRA